MTETRKLAQLRARTIVAIVGSLLILSFAVSAARPVRSQVFGDDQAVLSPAIPGTSTASASSSPPLTALPLATVPLQANLQDGIGVNDSPAAPAAANLTEAVNALDAYAAPVQSAFSDTVYALDQYAQPASASLSDAVRLVDERVAPIEASLSDVVRFADRYGSLRAILSDTVRVVGAYVNPIRASLSDALGVIDRFLSPATGHLTDLVGISDHLTTSNSIRAGGIVAGLAVLGGLMIRRERKQRTRG